MDVARRLRLDPEGDEAHARLRPRPETPGTAEELDKVLRFSPGSLGLEIARERPAALTARDITQAIDLVHDAAQTIRSAEERVREGEARTQTLLQRATEELKSAEAKIQAAEAKVRAAETRAQEAEARAKEAENWLRQIFSTISDELPRR